MQITQECPSGGPFERILGAMKRIFCVLLCLFITPCIVEARPALEEQKIQYLIDAIANLKGATFVRNGTEYDAQQAADHVRMKLRNAGSHVVTAQDFITLCATGSSVSGQPYKIRFADGHEVPSATFLREKLSQFQPPSPSP